MHSVMEGLPDTLQVTFTSPLSSGQDHNFTAVYTDNSNLIAMTWYIASSVIIFLYYPMRQNA